MRALKSYSLWQGGLQSTTVSGHHEWSGASLQTGVKHKIKYKLKVECSVSKAWGVLWVYCESLGCRILELLYPQLLEEGGPPSLPRSSSDGWRTWALIQIAVEERIHRHPSCLSSSISLCRLWRGLFLLPAQPGYHHWEQGDRRRGAICACFCSVLCHSDPQQKSFFGPSLSKW